MTGAETGLLVFARAPVPGQAKTRLIPVLGAPGAAALHARLVRHALGQAVAAKVGPVRLCCAPDARHPFFAECARDFEVELWEQQGADLGQRMAHALAGGLRAFGRILLMGTDCPALNPLLLRAAAQALQSHAAVFVPAKDGGYVLVGVRDAVPPIFDGVDWGSAAVMGHTRVSLQALGIRWQELPPLADIDTPRDLLQLRQTHPGLLEGLAESQKAPI